MPLPSETFKIFISHATSADGALANWIADALDRLHFRAYVYQRYQIGGQNRFETIKTMISTCPYFLVILTLDGIQSQWVNQEIGYAVAENKNPIPLVEVDPATRMRVTSQGFVELHDPIDYYKTDNITLMANIIYTIQSLQTFSRLWRDLVYLSCQCGNDFEGQLLFRQNWGRYLQDPNRNAFPITYNCAICNRQVVISFPDCHMIP